MPVGTQEHNVYDQQESESGCDGDGGWFTEVRRQSGRLTLTPSGLRTDNYCLNSRQHAEFVQRYCLMGITVDERFHPDLAEAVRRLVDCFQPERIYLFGSRARGDARDDSDYDILIVVRDGQQSGFRAAQQAYKALWGLDLSIEIVVATAFEFNREAKATSSLPAATLREGSLLYAA
jgi:uncharacterized protein